MAIEWRKFCRGDSFSLLDDGVQVVFESGRTQKVVVEDRGDSFLLRSQVARASAVRELPDAPLQAWLRNRSVPLVGFRVNGQGRMVGECLLPKCGLTESEFVFALRRVASECDRFEYQLTGRDQE